jgi:hypothetical protein
MEWVGFPLVTKHNVGTEIITVGEGTDTVEKADPNHIGCLACIEHDIVSIHVKPCSEISMRFYLIERQFGANMKIPR